MTGDNNIHEKTKTLAVISYIKLIKLMKGSYKD